MGAKYNWKFGKFWIELTPLIYVRINKKTEYAWKTIFEFWI